MDEGRKENRFAHNVYLCGFENILVSRWFWRADFRCHHCIKGVEPPLWWYWWAVVIHRLRPQIYCSIINTHITGMRYDWSVLIETSACPPWRGEGMVGGIKVALGERWVSDTYVNLRWPLIGLMGAKGRLGLYLEPWIHKPGVGSHEATIMNTYVMHPSGLWGCRSIQYAILGDVGKVRAARELDSDLKKSGKQEKEFLWTSHTAECDSW